MRVYAVRLTCIVRDLGEATVYIEAGNRKAAKAHAVALVENGEIDFTFVDGIDAEPPRLAGTRTLEPGETPPDGHTIVKAPAAAGCTLTFDRWIHPRTGRAGPVCRVTLTSAYGRRIAAYDDDVGELSPILDAARDLGGYPPGTMPSEADLIAAILADDHHPKGRIVFQASRFAVKYTVKRPVAPLPPVPPQPLPPRRPPEEYAKALSEQAEDRATRLANPPRPLPVASPLEKTRASIIARLEAENLSNLRGWLERARHYPAGYAANRLPMAEFVKRVAPYPTDIPQESVLVLTAIARIFYGERAWIAVDMVIKKNREDRGL